MMIKASGRSALILATGLFVCFAGPSQVMAAAADNATTAAKPDSATSGKSARQSSRHVRRTAHRKSGKVASKPAETKKADAKDVADTAVDSQPVIPASVANANAELIAADVPADSARGMSQSMTAKANVVLAAADKPADGQAASDAAVVSSDQLNDVDRALQQNPAAAPNPAASPNPASTQTVAMASTIQAVKAAAPVLAASSDSSTWDETSLIGKIFIGFGALLTIASAARMFMA